MSRETHRPSIRSIINTRKDAYYAARMKDMVVDRGMNPKAYVKVGEQLFPDPTGNNRGYKETLPTFEGRSVDQVISAKVESSVTPVRILDIGCGEGNFLKDCKKRWGDSVETFGITARRYDYNENSDVGIIVGDAQSLINSLDAAGLPIDGYNLVVCMFTLRYIVDYMATIKQVYKILGPEGIALIDYTPDYGQEPERFLNKNEGVKVDDRGIAFKKNNLPLTGPISYKRISQKRWADRPNEISYKEKH